MEGYGNVYFFVALYTTHSHRPPRAFLLSNFTIMAGFIKYMKSEEAKNLLSNMAANHLLNVIAQRASYLGNPVKNIEVGESFLGDFEAFGMTRQQYRTALENLQKWGYITTRVTNRGTVAKLASSLVYCISYYIEQPTEQPTEQPSGNQQPTSNQPSGNHNIEYLDNKEIEDSLFDKRLNLQLPFDVVSTSETIRATYQKPFLELKEDLKNIFGIEPTDSDIETAIKTFATVAVGSYDKYQSIRQYEKLCNLFKEWIPKSIKFEGSKPKAQPLQLEPYLLQHYREKDVLHFKEKGDFSKWETTLTENLFKLTNIAKGYKNENLSPLFFFEIMYMPFSLHLNGSKPERKIESFEKIFSQQSDYNKEKGDFRKIIKANYEKIKA